MLSLGIIYRFDNRFREQARSHNGPAVNTPSVYTNDPLWERACSKTAARSPPSSALYHTFL
ncbi:hypothetical protein EGM97_20590 [Pseudomonas sp. AF32]|nr:hypothetical protein [Pseudomonas sp. AF32]